MCNKMVDHYNKIHRLLPDCEFFVTLDTHVSTSTLNTKHSALGTQHSHGTGMVERILSITLSLVTFSASAS